MLSLMQCICIPNEHAGPCFEPYGSEILSDAEPVNTNSALDLLVSADGDQSDSIEDIRDRKSVV